MKISSLLSLLVLSALLLVPVNSNYAKDNKTSNISVVEKSSKWFPQCLKSKYTGVVESTIYNIVLLKKYYPEVDFSRYVSALKNIADKHSDAAVRYKAHLAVMYLGFSDIINIAPASSFDTHDYIFDQISEQLNNKLLVNN